MKKMMKKQGFTLIELMVVVIIVGILAAVAVPLMSANTGRARSTEVSVMAGAIETAAKQWRVHNNTSAAGVTLAQLISGGFLSAEDLVGRYANFNTTAPTFTCDATGRISAFSYSADLDGDGINDTVSLAANGTYQFNKGTAAP